MNSSFSVVNSSSRNEESMMQVLEGDQEQISVPKITYNCGGKKHILKM
jgi:hypothetical protein